MPIGADRTAAKGGISRREGRGSAAPEPFQAPNSLMSDRPIRLAERIESLLARVLVRLPGHLHVRMSGEPPVVADGGGA